MEEYSSPLCSTYVCQEEGIEEVRHCLLYISELETTIVAIKEEIRRREVEIANVKVVLNNTIKERNEAEQQSKTLLIEKIMLQQKVHKKEQPMQPRHISPPLAAAADEALEEMLVKMGGEKALPEKGKLLQAVKEAGPLLQTLALAGPLPQWQRPPPPPPPSIAGDTLNLSFSPTNYPNVSFFS